MRKTLERRQEDLDLLQCASRVEKLLEKLWPDAGIHNVTLMVSGQHEPEDPKQIELSLVIHFSSTGSISAFPGKSYENVGNVLTLLPSAGSTPMAMGSSKGVSGQAKLSGGQSPGNNAMSVGAQYTGRDPPTIPP